jgi:hypothetical protein
MIRLNETANGKRRFFKVAVLREWDVITCDEDPIDAIKEMYQDGHLDGGFKPDKEELKIKEVEQ